MTVMSTGPQLIMLGQQINIIFPYISPHNHWINFQTLTPIKRATMQGQKCFRVWCLKSRHQQELLHRRELLFVRL